MESRFELVGGEQNGQTVQPLVANQNVESLAHEIKKRKNREAAKKRCEEKKQRMEENARQLEETRAENVELKKRVDKQKKKHAVSSGKLEQMQKYIELIIGDRKLLQQAIELQITTAKQQNTMINILMQRIVAGTINQFGATMEPGGLVFEESLPQSHQVERAHWNNVEQPGLTYGGDLNYTSLLGAAMASGSSLMQGSRVLGGQGNNSEQPTPYNADQFPGVN